VIALWAPSPSWAQSCGGTATLGNIQFPIGPPIATAAAVTNSLVSSITAANTAFLTQSSALVGAPANPKPDSQGGGLWIRSVDGYLNATAGATGSGVASVDLHIGHSILPISAPLTANCVSSVHEDFAGFQIGQDISRLNVGGWYVHAGATAGYMETRGSSASPEANIGTLTQVPFIGSYVAASNGGFLVDGIIRLNDYQTTINAPGVGFFDQTFGAHGVTIAGSIGYNWRVPNSSWFIEPSAGVVWSNVSVDPIAANGPTIRTTVTLPGTTQISDIISTIGRAGVRFGTTIQGGGVVWQPFAVVSVWHEFGGDSTTSFTTCANCGVSIPAPPFGTLTNPSIAASLSTQNIGTFGQYSLGLNAQLEKTGWLGFARVDYRDGDRIEGWSGTAGFRYQFNPAGTAAAMPVKAPVYKAPAAGPYNWTGFYAGVLGGGTLDDTQVDVPAARVSTSPHTSGVLGGGQIGYNYQTGAWVLGVEADAAWTNASGSRECGPLVVGTSFFNSTCHDSVDGLATVTGRLGYTWDRALFYAKAGIAFADESISATCNFGPTNASQPQRCVNAAGAPFDQISAISDRAGLTIGYGVEFALTNHWSAKGEFDYIDFGGKSLTASDGTVFNAGAHLFEGKIGLNYHF
jgi:opacity protein-like surface antigen